MKKATGMMRTGESIERGLGKAYSDSALGVQAKAPGKSKGTAGRKSAKAKGFGQGATAGEFAKGNARMRRGKNRVGSGRKQTM